MKKVLSIIVLVLLAGYIAFATVTLCRKPQGQVCRGVNLEIRDSLKTGYMTTQDIITLLTKQGLDPTDQPLDEVNLQVIEEALETSPLISSCECYKTIGGRVVVEVTCRRPILRILNSSNESYYLDEAGEVIERISKAVYVPVATGHITREYARTQLLPLAHFLHEEPLWNAQIAQIHVTQRGELELTPRVGSHTIVLGPPGDYAHKFDKLKTFYEKGLNELGWDRYTRIDVGHGDQVVATKKKK